jgi:predicted nucleic acid-binding protein
VTVVDTSVWVDYFNGVTSPEAQTLDGLLGTSGDIVVGDLILAEVLQGFRADSDFAAARAALGAFPVVSMVGTEMAVQSARNYRRLRRLGVTVRKTIDVIIATWCIESGHDLLYSDRDFDPCVEHLGLHAVTGSAR